MTLPCPPTTLLMKRQRNLGLQATPHSLRLAFRLRKTSHSADTDAKIHDGQLKSFPVMHTSCTSSSKNKQATTKAWSVVYRTKACGVSIVYGTWGTKCMVCDPQHMRYGKSEPTYSMKNILWKLQVHIQQLVCSQPFGMYAH